jgi:hypothetical protein
MKYSVLLILGLIIAGVMVAGCQSTAPQVTPSETVITTTEPTPSPQPSFALGNHFLEKKYSFSSENDIYTEQFRVPAGQPWGVEFKVNPLNDDLQYCWFVLKLTNMDTGQTDTFGYGRENGFEKDQTHPMYGGGPYQVELRGNRVSVQVNIAERSP